MEIKTVRGWLFLLLMIIVAFPFAQHGLSFFESSKLKGAIVLAADTTFSWSGWWCGAYQKQKTLYLNDNAGLRPELLLLNNQLDYSIFHKLHARDVILGKDDYLFEIGYINEYYGLDYLGDEELYREIIKLKKIQDTLEHLGKTFVFAYAGSKAYYYTEKIPSSLQKNLDHPKTNYSTYKRVGDSIGLHQLDFNLWLTKMKDTTKHLLYNRQGTHWTIYASLLVADSIIKYIEKERNIKMPELEWKEIENTDAARGTDNDMSSGLNLISELKKERLSYPKYYYTFEGNRTRPKTIFIGDSFMWTMVKDNLIQNVSLDYNVWYYFYECWTSKSLSGQEPMKHIDDINWPKAMLNTDCVVIMFSPPSFKGFNYSEAYVNKIYKYFYPEKDKF